MVEFLPFHPDHLVAIGVLDHEGRVPSWAAWSRSHGNSYSFAVDGEIVCSFGLAVFWEGTGELWLIPGKSFKDKAKTVVRYVGKAISDMVEMNNMRHVYADVSVTSEAGHRFMKHFGFRPSGMFKYFDPEGNDVIRWSLEVNRERSGS